MFFLSCWYWHSPSPRANFRLKLNQAIINTNLSSMWMFFLRHIWQEVLTLQYQSRYKISTPNQKISILSIVSCLGKKETFLVFFLKLRKPSGGVVNVKIKKCWPKMECFCDLVSHLSEGLCLTVNFFVNNVAFLEWWSLLQ